MHANHSPLQFFGLTAMVSALASRVYANAALAWTMASTAKSNGASASPVPVGTSRAPETGPRSRVGGTRTALDSNRTSRAPRSATTPGGLLGPTSGPPESALATPGQQLGPITTSTQPAEASSPTPARRSTRADVGVIPLVGGGHSAGAPTSATVRLATTTTTAPSDRAHDDSRAGTPGATQFSGRLAPSLRPHATPSTATPSTATPSTRDAAAGDKVRRDGAVRHEAARDTARRDTAERDELCRDRTCRDRPRRDTAVQRSVTSAPPRRPEPEADPASDLREEVENDGVADARDQCARPRLPGDGARSRDWSRAADDFSGDPG